MEISCQKCQTAYSLDERLLSPSGTPVRCTNCDHVFTAYPPKQIKLDPHVPWLLKTSAGEAFRFNAITELQAFVADRRALRDDEVSRFGGPWKTIESIPELSSFLTGGNLPRTSGAPSPSPSPSPTPGPAVRHQTFSGTGQQPVQSGQPAPAGAPRPSVETARSTAPERKTEPPPPLQSPTAERAPTPAPAATASNVQKTAAWKAPAKTVPDNPPPAQTPAPAVDSSLVTGRTIRESMLSGATIRDNRGAAGQPAVNTAPPDTLVTGRTIRESMLSGRTLRKSLVAGDTIPETPAVTAAHVTGRPVPAGPSAETARAATLKAAPAVASPTAAPESAGYSMGRQAETNTAEFDFSKVPTGQTETWSRGKTQPIRKDPAWTRSGTTTSTTTVDQDDLDLDDSPRRRRGLVTAIVVAAVLLVGGGIAWLVISKGDLLQSQLGEAQDQKNEEREKLLLLDAREKFLLDTPTDFALAEKKYLQVLSISRDNAQAMAELALMYAVRAQYTLDELVDAQVDRKNTESLQSRFESQVEEARRYATGAIDLAPRLPDAHLAMADADRLSGAIDSARGHIRKARSDSTLTEAAVVDALISIADRGDRAEIIGMLKSSIANPPLLRSLYRLARVQASAGRLADAKATLSELFHVNANHPQGRRLKERLEKGHKVELLPGASAASPAAAPVAVESAAAPDVPAEPAAGTPAATSAPATTGTTGTTGTTATATPAGTDGLLEKAAKAQDSGKYADALTLYGQVLDKEPSNLDALTGMAATYMEMKNWGQAIAKFKKALGVNGRFGPALIGIAQTYKSMGQPLVALSWFEKYLEANPSGRDAEIARRNIDALRSENAVSGGSPDTASQPEEPPSDAAPESPEAPTAPPPSEPAPDAQPVE